MVLVSISPINLLRLNFPMKFPHSLQKNLAAYYFLKIHYKENDTKMLKEMSKI